MWPFRPKSKRVSFGGEHFEIIALTLEQTLELMLVLAPHLALIESHLPRFKQLLADSSGDRPELLRMLFITMRDDMRRLPGDITKALALLCGIEDPVWLAKNAKPQEFLEAVLILDEVHDFKRLWGAIKGLGVSVGYQ